MTGKTSNVTSRRSTIPSNVVSKISYLSLFAFYVLLIFITVSLDWAKLTQKPDILVHDLWTRFNSSPAPKDVIIIGIDSRSLQEVGRWPWSRKVQADLVMALSKSGLASLTLDILFTEPDSLSSDNDIRLAQAISEHNKVVLPILTGEYSAGKSNPESLPIPPIIKGVSGLGHVFLPVDPDGLIRRVNLKSGFRSAHWSTLSLALSEVIGEVPETLPGQRLKAPEINQSWVSDYQVYIPFYGQSGSIETVSASQVISGQIPLTTFKDKHVFVGVTAVGLGDILPTAVSTDTHPMPGVEVHATIFSSLRDGRLVTAAGAYISPMSSSILLLIILIIYVRLAPSMGLFASLLLASVPIILSYFLYMVYQLWYPPLAASLPLLMSYPLWSWHRLDFVSRFIQDEIDEMDVEMPPVTSSNSRSLVSYMDAAIVHLPISGWKFISNGQIFENGTPITEGGSDTKGVNWTATDNGVYCKSYKTVDRLQIFLKIDDSTYADEIVYMVDSLSRVRDRKRVHRRLDTVESLQLKAERLSNRMGKLRRINTASESIFHGSPAGLVVWNMAGEFTRTNELALKMLPNLLSDEPIFYQFLVGLGRDPANSEANLMRDLLIGKKSWQIEYEQDEREMVLDFNVIGHRFSDRLLVASIVDVSIVRASERARAEMLEYLSHDLRSPLISSAYLLSTQKEETPNADWTRINRIESNIDRSLSMIDDLLNMSRADNLKPDELEPVLFDNVINNTLDQLMPQAQGKSIKIVLDQNDEDELWVNGNAILLERAVINVLGNAIKYSSENTTVTVSVSSRDDMLRCEVLDEGIGFDKTKLSTLFQRFKRDDSVEREYQGTGLGLALVARVVKQHRGRVWAESLSKGALVVIELPLVSGE